MFADNAWYSQSSVYAVFLSEISRFRDSNLAILENDILQFANIVILVIHM